MRFGFVVNHYLVAPCTFGSFLVRVEAIHKSEEGRQLAASNRSNPLVEELIKTKEILKSPCARRDNCHIRRGESFESAVNTNRTTQDLNSISKGGKKSTGSYDRISLERCSSYSPTTESSDKTLLSTNEFKPEEIHTDRTMKISQSLPLKGTLKGRLNKGELSPKKEGASLRELLNDEIVSWGEQRDRNREKELNKKSPLP